MKKDPCASPVFQGKRMYLCWQPSSCVSSLVVRFFLCCTTNPLASAKWSIQPTPNIPVDRRSPARSWMDQDGHTPFLFKGQKPTFISFWYLNRSVASPDWDHLLTILWDRIWAKSCGRKFDLAVLGDQSFPSFSEHDRGVWHHSSDLLDPVPPPGGLSQGGYWWRARVRASPLQVHSLRGLPGASQSPRYQLEWSPPWLLRDFKHNRGRGMSSGSSQFNEMLWRLTSQHCVALLSGLDGGVFSMWELQAGEEVVWLFDVLHLQTCECVDVFINLYIYWCTIYHCLTLLTVFWHFTQKMRCWSC